MEETYPLLSDVGEGEVATDWETDPIEIHRRDAEITEIPLKFNYHKTEWTNWNQEINTDII